MRVTTAQVRAFRALVWKHYRAQGRHTLPWRKTKDPYKVLVSEIMLQQTQVSRVLPQYTEFLKVFPNVRSLATAPLAEVLKAWQGLGYNRRAKFLHELAKEVISKYQGKLPRTEVELTKLPGIGKATASAIMAFAYNARTTYLETNVRSAFLYYFFKGKDDVTDSELLPLIKRASEGQDPRTWNWALLDFGAYIKQKFGNPNVRSKHYVRQSKFIGSNRQIRGQMLRALTVGTCARAELFSLVGSSQARAEQILAQLLAEGLVSERRGRVRLGS
jgi:A/G-specific adenine glycosylase